MAVQGKLELGKVQTSLVDQFVVATEHESLVRDLLGRYADELDAAPTLGLSLLEVRDIDAALRHVPEPEAPPPPPRARPDGPLDELLAKLRAYFGAKYGGWAPTLGKNRLVNSVQLSPYPNVGAGDMPEPAKLKSLPSAMETSPGRDVDVALLDTDVFEHPLLAGRYTALREYLIPANGRHKHLWQQWPPWGSSSLLQYPDGHGTFVGGVILNAAPGAVLTVDTVLTGKGLEEARAGRGFAPVWTVAKRLAATAESGVDIVNCSFSVYTDDGQEPLVMTRAVQRLTARAVVVAATGNHGDPNMTEAERTRRRLPGPNAASWPAASDGVVAVGATDTDGRSRAWFTPDAPWVNLLAPGVNIPSTYLDARVQILKGKKFRPAAARFKGSATWSGTSFSAAAVTGAIAALTVPGQRSSREALCDLVTAIGRFAGPPGFRLLTPPA
jgi:subtilisin family serine protease